LRYFLAGHDDSPEAVQENSCRGKWLHGTDSNEYLTVGGYPPRILDAKLANLFQRGFSNEPETRPLLPEWRDVLLNALKNVSPCPRCRKPVIVDHSLTTCPHCNRPFPTLKAVAPGLREIVINDAEICLGRAELGGASNISRRHAYFRKLGPDIYVESVGKAGTYLLNGHGWERLGDYVPAPLEGGQSLRIGNVEVQLVRCEMDGHLFKP